MTSNSTAKRRFRTSPIDWPFPPLLQPLRSSLNGIEITDRRLAHWLCRVIPAQCPFERTVSLLGRHLFHIPPLCKFNPVYDEVIMLRFRALSFLAEHCQDDISGYIR